MSSAQPPSGPIPIPEVEYIDDEAYEWDSEQGEGEDGNVEPLAYNPNTRRSVMTKRALNPIVFMEISSMGGRKERNGIISKPTVLGRLYFELRKDLAPIACENFLSLIEGRIGLSPWDGVNYNYKGTRIHRIVKNQYMQGGDLIDSKGDCSRSVYNRGGLFCDENFIFRHTGPGVLSYCNRGPNTNGSLYQITFRHLHEFDERYVVFGCLCAPESFEVLMAINRFGTTHGEPLEEVRVTDCGLSFPLPIDPETEAAAQASIKKGDGGAPNATVAGETEGAPAHSSASEGKIGNPGLVPGAEPLPPITEPSVDSTSVSADTQERERGKQSKAAEHRA